MKKIEEQNQIKAWASMLSEAMSDKSRLVERRMDGPAAAARGGVDEIADMRQKLANGVVEFEFTKADGTLRHAVGTTSEQVVPTAERRRLDPTYDENMASYARRQNYIIWFWDIEKHACRCFNTNRFERIINTQTTQQRVGLNVDRVGNIFIHQDVDPTMQNDDVSDEQLQTVNGELNDYTNEQGNDLEAVLSEEWGGHEMSDFAPYNFSVERSPEGNPILRIVLRKDMRNVNEDRLMYPLNIGDLVTAIEDRWHVQIVDVYVDGQFKLR